MAFKLRSHPTIKGSPAQRKASMAKATVPEPTVAATRTKADPSLVYAGVELGKSYVPGAVDYNIDGLSELKYRDDEENKVQPWDDQPKDETGDGVPGCMDSTAENYNAAATKDDGSCTYISEGDSSSDSDSSSTTEENQEFTATEFPGNTGDPYTYRTTESGGYQYKCETCTPPVNDWTDATTQGAIDAISKRDPAKQESIAKLRNKRIYRNAVSGGKIQRKLINNGYDPYKSI